MVPENQIKTEPISVRIKFKKYGSLIYISHLDLSRTMQRIMVRAGIDIWYSEGFNPQPKIVFAAPLPLGTESECEYMDIKINSYMSNEEIKERLIKNSPPELEIVSVYTPTCKFKEIAYISYDIEINSPKNTKELSDIIGDMFNSEFKISKKTKSGEREVNISEYIKSVKSAFIDGKIKIEAVLCADSEKYLNPELFMEAIKQKTGLLTSGKIDETYSIIRKAMLKADLSTFE